MAASGTERRVAVLRVTGMTCGACSGTVERALGAMAGVVQANVSCVTHQARVCFDASTVSLDALLEAVDDVGFEASVLEEKPLGGTGKGAGPETSDATCTLRVEGMTCGACSGTVERALQAAEGVATASVSCVTHLAHVRFDPRATTPQALCEVVDDVGFEASVLEAPPCRSSSEQPQGLSVELEVKGMTCAVCSGTIERHLRSLPGVRRASVNLLLHRAFVICEGGSLSAEALVDEIDSIGFEASVIASGPTGAVQGAKANLHVAISSQRTLLPLSQPPKAKLQDFDASARMVNGVQACYPHKGQGNSVAVGVSIRQVVYDPTVVGARSLLEKLKESTEDLDVEWVNVGMENEQVHHHMKELASLRRDFLRAAPFAFAVLLFVIVLPSCGVGYDEMGVLAMPVHHGVDVLTICVLLLSTPVQFVVGRRFHRAAFKAIKRKSPNMDVLVSVSTSTAYFYSLAIIIFCMASMVSGESHMLSRATMHFLTMGPVLITIVLLGKFLEARAKLAAIQAMTDLPASMPSVATLCSESGGDQQIAVELIELDDVLRIFNGAKIPVDGQVCSENAVYVDESLLTGESHAILKNHGETLFSGSTCVSGGCLLRVTRTGADTMLGQMVTLVQEAQGSKAEVQRMADRVARVFVPSVVALSFLTFLVWSALVFGGVVKVPMEMAMPHSKHMHDGMMQGGHMEAQDSLKLLFAMKFGMAVLMIACPCAMGLATPMAVMVATGIAAKRGCLVKSAAALETAAKLDAIVLDKTGTITAGTPVVQGVAVNADAFDGALLDAWFSFRRSQRQSVPQVKPQGSGERVPPVQVIGRLAIDSSMSAQMQDCFWWLLGLLESSSDHPLAKCVLSTVRIVPNLPQVSAPTDFEYLSGRGVRCVVPQLGGITARVGNLQFFEDVAAGRAASAAEAELLEWVRMMQNEGHTVALVHADLVPLGAVAMSDPIREDAEWVVDFFSKTLGLEVWMCTGDNTATAKAIAEAVGIKNVVAEALPTAKSQCVQQLQRQGGGKKVCFVGDGINDSIALAQADVGIAIGVGAQVAMEAADVTLVRSELSDCAMFLSLSKRTVMTICLNLFWAFCFNFVCLPMAAGLFYPRVHIPPLAAGIGMASSSCLVVFTSLALRLHRSPKTGVWRRPKRARDLEKVPLADPTATMIGSSYAGAV